MKKIASCILAAILAATVLAEETSSVDYGQATQAPTLDLIWRFERETTAGVTYAVITGVAVTSGDNPAGEIDVPVSLVASDGTALIVKKIGANAFQNQIGITSVSIPYQIQSVGPGTFSGCTVLSSINVDSSNPWLSSSSGVLYDKDSEELIACPAITESVSLPQSLKKIGEEAFADCFRLKDITIPTSVKSIGTNAFLRCTRLDSITFNGDAPTVGATPFNGTKDGMTVYVPQDNKTYGEVPGTWNGRHTEYSNADGGGGSGGDDGVEGYYTDDDGVIWAITVYGKSNTAELGAYGKKPVISTSASGMLTVPSEVILNNGGAESILTSKKYSVKSIPDGAFSGCDKITGVNIPASIASIGSDAFNGCTSLTIIAVSSSSKYYSSRNGILYSKDGKTLVKVPAKTSFAATFTEQETATKKDIVEVIGSTDPTTMTTDPNQIIELKSYGTSTTTTTTEFFPAVSIDKILSGVTAISDYAFTDCGLMPEGSTVSGTMVVKVNGKETGRKTGKFELPVGTDSTGGHTNSYIYSQAGFYKGSVCLYHTVSDSDKTVSYEIPINIPTGISYGNLAFYNSHFTSKNTTVQAPPVVVVNSPVDEPDDDLDDTDDGFGVRPYLVDANGNLSAIEEGDVVEANVGIMLSIPLSVGNAPDGSLSTVTAKGLPAGVKLAKTAVKEGRKVVKYIYAIEGTPSRVQDAKTVVLKVTNKKNKLNSSVSFSIKVLAMPGWVAGKYNGVCFDGTKEVGSATAAITAAGKLSGKIMVPSDDGKKALKLSYSAKGFSGFDEKSGTFHGTATMRVNGQTVEVPFTLSAYDGAGQLSLELPGMTAALEQNTWKRGDIVATTIEVDGFKFKLSANGKVKWSGSVEGDNGRMLSVSGSTQLLSGPSVLVYIPPKSNLVGGRCELFQLQ